MGIVQEVIGQLETFTITREELEVWLTCTCTARAGKRFKFFFTLTSQGRAA